MKILVANLGSTSFKYRLFDMADERQLARGGVERVGAASSRCFVETGGERHEHEAYVPDHGVAVEQCLAQLSDLDRGCLDSAEDVAGIGFKAVHGGRYSGVQRVNDDVLAAMEEMADVAPAHNPMYVAAMGQMQSRLPGIPLVAAFETGFHATIPDRLRTYAVPLEWAEEYHVRRWGFHGASHRFIASRTAQLLERDDLRVISCHLGGSSSLCAIRHGQSVATTMGMSPQTGLPQSNRAGEFDPYAVRLVMRRSGKTLDQVLDELGSQSGLLGLSGTSGDIRDLEAAAAAGDERSRLALDVYTSAVRHYLGAYLVELGGCDVIAFTGGIGENSAGVRRAVCAGLAELGIVLDDTANETARAEVSIHAGNSRTAVWIVPTNEELIVARQTKELLEAEM